MSNKVTVNVGVKIYSGRSFDPTCAFFTSFCFFVTRVFLTLQCEK